MRFTGLHHFHNIDKSYSTVCNVLVGLHMHVTNGQGHAQVHLSHPALNTFAVCPEYISSTTHPTAPCT